MKETGTDSERQGRDKPLQKDKRMPEACTSRNGRADLDDLSDWLGAGLLVGVAHEETAVAVRVHTHAVVRGGGGRRGRLGGGRIEPEAAVEALRPVAAGPRAPVGSGASSGSDHLGHDRRDGWGGGGEVRLQTVTVTMLARQLEITSVMSYCE